MIDIAIKDGKWIFVNGDIQFIDGAERVRQELEFALSLWRGEWFLDPDAGTPYYNNILGKGMTPQGASAAIRQQIMAVEGVRAITDFSYEFDRKARKLTVNFECATDYGIVTYGA